MCVRILHFYVIISNSVIYDKSDNQKKMFEISIAAYIDEMFVYAN